jgi:hypothetical protein
VGGDAKWTGAALLPEVVFRKGEHREIEEVALTEEEFSNAPFAVVLTAA